MPSRRVAEMLTDGEIRSHLYHHSYVVPEAKLLYVETPKVACTALKNWLVRATGRQLTPPPGRSAVERGRDHLVHTRELVPIPSLVDLDADTLEDALEGEDWIRCCLTRNPYARTYSAWQGKILLGDPALLGRFGPPGAHDVFDESGRFDVRASFRAFATDLRQRPTWYLRDMHFRPQHAITLRDHIAYTDVVDLGAIDEFIDRLRLRMRESGLDDPGQLPRMNQGFGLPWAAAYDNVSRDVVLDAYREDFARFGYSTALVSGQTKPTLSERETVLLSAIHNRERWVLAERLERDRDRARIAVLERSLRDGRGG